MENPKGSFFSRFGPLLLGLGVILVGSIVVNTMRRPVVLQDAAAIVGLAEPKKCRLNDDGLGNAAINIKASTLTVPWRLFDQRFTLLPINIKSLKADGIPGGYALNVKMTRAEKFAYAIGVSVLNQRPILRGELIEVRVWLRATPAQNAPVTIIARLQDNEPGFRGLREAALTLSPEFKEYTIASVADRDFCAGSLNFALHLATGIQTVDVGPAILMARRAPPA